MTLHIKIDDLNDSRIAEFLEAHIKDMRSVSPPESKHALDLEGLKKPEITFWSAWDAETLLGCVAIKRLDASHCELKSMRTAPESRQQGLGKLLLHHALNEAKAAGFETMSLETGSMAFFIPARSLYEGNGFRYCEPFGAYKPDPNSVFMTRTL